MPCRGKSQHSAVGPADLQDAPAPRLSLQEIAWFRQPGSSMRQQGRTCGEFSSTPLDSPLPRRRQFDHIPAVLPVFSGRAPGHCRLIAAGLLSVRHCAISYYPAAVTAAAFLTVTEPVVWRSAIFPCSSRVLSLSIVIRSGNIFSGNSAAVWPGELASTCNFFCFVCFVWSIHSQSRGKPE